MALMDGGWLVGNALWIIGLSVLLATFGYRAWQQSLPTADPQQSARRGGTAPFYLLGALLVALGGLLVSAERWRRGAG